MSKIILLFKKEIIDAIRDSRTFIVCIVMPFILYPILFAAMGFFIVSEKNKEEQLIYKIGIINQRAMPGLLTELERTKRYDIVEREEPSAMFKNENVKVIIHVKCNDSLLILYNGADKESNNAMRRIEMLLSEYRYSRVRIRILEEGLDESILNPFAIEKVNIAPSEKMGGFLLGILIPYMLMILAFQGAMRMAVDITAGEKERKTIETLLVTDIKRSEIIISKCLATFALALMTTVFGLVGLVITVQSGLSLFGQLGNLSLTIPWLSCLLMLIVMFPLLLLFSVMLVAIGSAARSTNQANTYAIYCLIVVIVLAIFSVVRMTSPETMMFFIPVLNAAISQQQILVGKVNIFHLIITMGSSIVYAAVAYLFTKHSFEKEEILFRN
jgi:sodium transport system permease protein